MLIVAPGRSQRKTLSNSGRGKLIQPFVALPLSSCRKIAEPRPGTAGCALYSTKAKLAVGTWRLPERFARAAERRCRAAGDVFELVVRRRGRILVPPVAAHEVVVAEVNAGIRVEPVDGGADRKCAERRRPVALVAVGRDAAVADPRCPRAAGRLAALRQGELRRGGARRRGDHGDPLRARAVAEDEREGERQQHDPRVRLPGWSRRLRSSRLSSR